MDPLYLQPAEPEDMSSRRKPLRAYSWGGAIGSFLSPIAAAAPIAGCWATSKPIRIRAAGISGRGLTARISAVFQLGLGWLQARRLLKRLRPRAVAGFGGYPSVPTVVAASQLQV